MGHESRIMFPRLELRPRVAEKTLCEDKAMSRDPWNVCVVAYDGLSIFEFGIMVELFGLPRPEFSPWYTLRVCGVEKGPLRASGGVQVEVPHSLRVLDRAGTIILPGWRQPLTEVPKVLRNKLRDS